MTIKLGKLIKKKQRTKTFEIREILVSIETEKRTKTFVALVNERSGRVMKKQGRRINEPLDKISKRSKFQN